MRTILPCLLIASGCVAVQETPAGQETGPCIDGACFDGLECLSDLCVGPDAEPGGTDDAPSTASASGPASGSGPSSGPTSQIADP